MCFYGVMLSALEASLGGFSRASTCGVCQVLLPITCAFAGRTHAFPSICTTRRSYLTCTGDRFVHLQRSLRCVSVRVDSERSYSVSITRSQCAVVVDTKRSPRGHYAPRRSVMYVPASDERKVRKAATLRADTLVFDLEDGVAVNQKVS